MEMVRVVKDGQGCRLCQPGLFQQRTTGRIAVFPGLLRPSANPPRINPPLRFGKGPFHTLRLSVPGRAMKDINPKGLTDTRRFRPARPCACGP